MSNATNISATRDDGTSIVLIPVSSGGIGDGKSAVVFRELSPTKPDDACVRLTLESELLKSGIRKITRTVEVPIMEIIPANAVNSDGRVAAPLVSHVEKDVRIRFHHPRCTATERADSLRIANHIDAYGGSTAGGGTFAGSSTPYIYRDVVAAQQTLYGDVNYVWPSA